MTELDMSKVSCQTSVGTTREQIVVVHISLPHELSVFSHTVACDIDWLGPVNTGVVEDLGRDGSRVVVDSREKDGIYGGRVPLENHEQLVWLYF